MKLVKTNVAILMATFLSAQLYAAAPVNDVTQSSSSTEIEKQIKELTRLLEVRNRMQVRFQNQLDELSQEVNQITGSIELFNHKIEQIENRQRSLYQLIDEQRQASTVAPVVDDPTASAPEGEKAAYKAALDLVLVDKAYSQAVVAFEAYVVDYPESDNIPNAQYWLGQLLYREKKREEARAAFLVVTDKYPESSKRADAMFKIGIIDEYLGNIDSAKLFYNKVVAEYPDASAASLAKKRLKAL